MGCKQNRPGPVTTALGFHLARLRKARGWTQWDVAGLVSERGRYMSPEVVLRIEHGLRKVDVDDLYAFANVFRTTPTSLLHKARRGR
jgi:transcriptional regulator with XRE-family HTH domain